MESSTADLLVDLGAMIEREVALDHLLASFGERVAHAMGADRATIWLVDAATDQLFSQVANLPELASLRLPIGRGVAGHVAAAGELVNINDAEMDARWAPDIDQTTGYHTRCMLCLPIVERNGPLRGVVQVLNAHRGHFTGEDEAFLRQIANQLAVAFEYTTLRGAGTPRGVPLRGRFNHIVGASSAMEAVYDHILRAAAVEATVLLHGETGTGKGLFARAIHVNSSRRDGPFVYVDCTTLPAPLIESELFGHERGAYTGASTTVKGKVESAHGGTLFLDEIGELPLGLQGKLLRFIQAKQFERVGGRETLSSDARIVVATNRRLEAMVAAGNFRSDLYYRVRVLDIELPPLRRRGAAEILMLADHFIAVYTSRMGVPSLALSPGARTALVNHPWPGNVRELQHAIERAVIVHQGHRISASDLGLVRQNLSPPPPPSGAFSLPASPTLDAVTRAYATHILAQNDGNQSATARHLGISRNRLARLLRTDPTTAP